MTSVTVRSAFSMVGIVVLAACGATSEPEATDVTWTVQRTADHKGYKLSGVATYVRGIGNGWYVPTLELVDDRGCHNQFEGDSVQDADKNATGTTTQKIDKIFELKRPVRRASFVILFESIPAGDMNPADIQKNGVFSEERLIDETVRPRDDLANPCNKPRSSVGVEHPTRAQLRERAKTDPDGADAQAIGNMSREEMVATAINSAGFLCARITDMYPDGGDIIANCAEYRSGRGRARYRINTTDMEVTKTN